MLCKRKIESNDCLLLDTNNLNFWFSHKKVENIAKNNNELKALCETWWWTQLYILLRQKYLTLINNRILLFRLHSDYQKYGYEIVVIGLYGHFESLGYTLMCHQCTQNSEFSIVLEKRRRRAKNMLLECLWWEGEEKKSLKSSAIYIIVSWSREILVTSYVLLVAIIAYRWSSNAILER